jgi:hypothetical protein
MPELTIGAIALAPVIAALVEGAKHIGLPSQFAPLLNAILSVVAYLVVSVYLIAHPEAVQITTVIVNALVIFLGAAGVYTTAKFATGN